MTRVVACNIKMTHCSASAISNMTVFDQKIMIKIREKKDAMKDDKNSS
jgi:hypothetical protein